MRKSLVLLLVISVGLSLNAYILNYGVGYGSMSSALYNNQVLTGVEYGEWMTRYNLGIDTTVISTEMMMGFFVSPFKNFRIGFDASFYGGGVSSLFDFSYSVDGFIGGDISGGMVVKSFGGFFEYYYSPKNIDPLRAGVSIKLITGYCPEFEYFYPDSSRNAYSIPPVGKFSIGPIIAGEIGMGPYHGTINLGYIGGVSPVYGTDANDFIFAIGGGLYFYPYLYTYLSYNLRSFNQWIELGSSFSTQKGRFNIFIMFPHDIVPFSPVERYKNTWVAGITISSGSIIAIKDKEKEEKEDTVKQVKQDTIYVGVKYEYKNVIMGVVKNKFGEPLKNVLVACGDKRVYTNDEGSFKFVIEKDGPVIIVFKKMGYKWHKESFVLKKGEGKVLEITMEEANPVYDVTGRIRYKGKPVIATIMVKPDTIPPVMSSPNGTYRLKLPPHEYIMEVYYNGQKMYEEPLIVKSSPIIRNINLTEGSHTTVVSPSAITQKHEGTQIVPINPTVNVYEEGGKLVTPPIEFFENGINLKDSSIPVIEGIAWYLSHNKMIKIEIRSYTDPYTIAKVGDITLARAEKIKKMICDYGINPNRIICKGYGSSNPIYDNATKYGRKMNNRIEIIVIK